MKLFIVLAAFIASIYSIPIAQQNDALFSQQLRTLIERQRQNFPCGWPDAGESGIAPLDPLFINEVVIETRGTGTSLTSIITNMNLVGLRNFVVQRLEVNSANKTISYRYLIEQMSLTARHSTRGSMIGIPVVSGNGPMTATMTNTWFEGILYWHTLPESGYIQFYDQIAWLDSQQIVVRMEGFGLMTNTVNRNINEMIPEMLADPEFQQQMNDIMNSVIFPVLNQALYHLTPEDAVKWLDYHANADVEQRCFW